jgi:ubiquinone biosynthesis protein UbiJ
VSSPFIAATVSNNVKAPDTFLGLLEATFNRYLALDPKVLEGCEALSGKLIAFHLREFDFTAYLMPGRSGVQVVSGSERKPDVTLSGSLPGFARLWLPRANEAEVLLSGAVAVEGDSELAQDFAHLLRQVHFDPEELLAAQVGSAAAHTIGRVTRGAFGIGRRTASVLGRDTAEYLREETRDLVHRADVQQWLDAVDRFHSDLDRLEARVRRLERKPGVSG